LNTLSRFLVTIAGCCIAGMAGAQSATPASKATAQSEAGEPRADTSSAPGPSGSASSTPAATTAAAPTAAAAAATPPSTVAAASGRTSGHAAPASSPAQKSGSKIDRLELGTATVTGSQEQPKVMYIVPWKRSDIGDLAGKPMNSLVDEILAPVDRDVFKREVVYYHAVQADASQIGAPLKPAQQGEK
jgi:hypothetical protein